MTTSPATQQQEREELISGSEAIAIACSMADVDTITAYPIRPYDTVMQYVSKLIAEGEFDCEFIVAESEHSQFEIVKHASSVGARTFVGSSGVGWFYAFEAITVTAGLASCQWWRWWGIERWTTRGRSARNITMRWQCETLGWLLNWVATPQEAYDTCMMAWRIAEDSRVFLPCAISCDGAFLTHSQSLVKVPPQSMVDEFLPMYNRGNLVLHPDNPITVAPQVNEDWLMEMRKQTDEAMKRAKGVVQETHEEFRRIFGRGTESPWFEEYMTDDAEICFIGLGTMSLPLRVAVRRARDRGIKMGFIRLKWFRPFATEEVREALSRFQAVAVIDRDYSYGSPGNGGVLFNEVRSALYPLEKRPMLFPFICGLGGREIHQGDVVEMIDRVQEGLASGNMDQQTEWIGVRR